MGGSERHTEFGAVPVSVSGDDLSNVTRPVAVGPFETTIRLKTKAKRVSVAEGESKTLHLELSGSITP